MLTFVLIEQRGEVPAGTWLIAGCIAIAAAAFVVLMAAVITSSATIDRGQETTNRTVFLGLSASVAALTTTILAAILAWLVCVR
jgi:hypothetical protein